MRFAWVDNLAALFFENARKGAGTPVQTVADPDLDQVTASQFTVDSEIEEGLVPQPPFAVEMEADRPNLLLCEGRLVPTFLPAFQAARACTAASNLEYPIVRLLGRDWPNEERWSCATWADSGLSGSGQ